MNHANHRVIPNHHTDCWKQGFLQWIIFPLIVEASRSTPEYINPTLGPFCCISNVNILKPCTWYPLPTWSHPMRHRLRRKTWFYCNKKTHKIQEIAEKKQNCFMLTYCYQAGHVDSSNPPAPGSLWVVPLTARTVQASSKPRPDGGKKTFVFTSTKRSFFSYVILIINGLDIVSTQTDVWCVDPNWCLVCRPKLLVPAQIPI